MFKLTDFKAELVDDTLSNHSFLVQLNSLSGETPLTQDLNSFIQQYSERLTLRCDRVNIPNQSLLLNDTHRRYGMGPIERVPYGVQFGDLQMSWVVDRSASIIKFFKDWLTLVVNSNSSGGQDMVTKTNGYNPYEVGYKDYYSMSVLNVLVYDKYSDKTITYEFYDVFPYMIPDKSLDWNTTDQLMKFDVNFHFTDMKISYENEDPVLRSIVSSPNFGETNFTSKLNDNLKNTSYPILNNETFYSEDGASDPSQLFQPSTGEFTTPTKTIA